MTQIKSETKTNIIVGDPVGKYITSTFQNNWIYIVINMNFFYELIVISGTKDGVKMAKKRIEEIIANNSVSNLITHIYACNFY